MLLQGNAEFSIGSRVQTFGGIALSAIDNPGIAHYGLGAGVTVLPAPYFQAAIQANHDQSSDWKTGENRISGTISGRPIRGLELGLGLAWRVPVMDSTAWYSPLVWQSAAAEWNYLYRIDWTFFHRPGVELAAWITNFDRLTEHTAQQFPFGLRGVLSPHNHWRWNARLGSDIKGLSGLLFSLGELDLQIGGSYVF